MRIFVQFWGSLFSFEDLCSVLRVFVQFWGSLFSFEDLCSVLRVFVQFWESLFSFESLCSVLRIFVQFWGSLFSFESLCLVLRIFVQFWESLFSFEDLCSVLRVFVQFWETWSVRYSELVFRHFIEDRKYSVWLISSVCVVSSDIDRQLPPEIISFVHFSQLNYNDIEHNPILSLNDIEQHSDKTS